MSIADSIINYLQLSGIPQPDAAVTTPARDFGYTPSNLGSNNQNHFIYKHHPTVNYSKGSYKTLQTNPEIQQAIIRESQAAGLDPALMLSMAHIESKFDPKAYNKSGASGLYQIMPFNWKSHGLDENTRFDVNKNIKAGIQHTLTNVRRFQKAFGRNPSEEEVYLMHQQGFGGLSKMVRNGNKRAVDVLGKKQVLQNGGNENMTVNDFIAKWGGAVRGYTDAYRQMYGLG